MIGALSVLYIYPLNIENYGLSQAIVNFSLFLVPFIGFNANSVVINYYNPNDKSPNDILSFGFFLSAIFSVLFLIIYFYAIRPALGSLRYLGINPSIFQRNSTYILSISVLMVFINTLINHSNNLKRAVVPNLLYNIGLKVFTPALILASYFKIIGSDIIPISFLIFYAGIFFLLCLYVWSLGGLPNRLSLKGIGFFTKKNVIQYSLISGLTGLAGIIATKIDIVTISGVKELGDIGKYSLPYFMASLIEIPLGGIASISGPFIAQYLKNNQIIELNDLLKKASNSLFLSGVVIFTMLYAIFPDLILLSNRPEVFKDGFIIFIIIGAAKLIDMVTSLNTQAISYSRFYIFNLYFVIITAIPNIFLTVYFTKAYGIIGTSVSLLLSIIIFNVLKTFLLKIKLGLGPFSKSTFLIIVIFTILIGIIQLLNISFAPLINIPIKITIVSASILVLVKILKPSEEVNEVLFGENGILTNGIKWSKIKKTIGL